MLKKLNEIIFNLKQLSSNDKNILMFMIGFISLVIQKPIEILSNLTSWIVFSLGIGLLLFSMFRSYLEDKEDGRWY